MWLIDFVVQEKLTQHCKATMLQYKFIEKKEKEDFPGGPVVKNMPHGFDHWSRRIPHASPQLSLWAQLLSPSATARASQRERPPQ